MQMAQQQCCCEFQSTLPVWGGTAVFAKLPPGQLFQSTLPVWGGTAADAQSAPGAIFQSTLPVWGGTICNGGKPYKVSISIHPPRVGRDGLL